MQIFSFQIRCKSDDINWNNIDKFQVKLKTLADAEKYAMTLVKKLGAQVRIYKPNESRFHTRVLNTGTPTNKGK